MLVLTLLWILSVTNPGSCSQCWNILNEPSGLNNFDIKLDYLLNGIVTIEGVLNLEHAPESGVPHKDLLKFIGEDDPNDAPILEIETQVNRRHQCIFISGTLKDENLSSIVTYPFLPNRKYICSENRDGSMKISQDNEVKLQISSIDMETLEGYEVYLGGFAKLLKHHLFKYGSLENWQKFEDRRIDGTRRIVNTCKQDCHLSYTKISVCSDPQPKLLDKMDVQVVRAELGNTYTLSCSASGAPYLGSEWRDKENSIIPGDEVFSYDGAEFRIESKLVISDFYTKDAGSYTCNIFNKNFGNGVEKLVSLQHLSISAPNSTYSFVDSDSTELVWTVKGHPLLKVRLECKSELGVLVPFYQRLEDSPLRLTFSYEFSKVDAPAMLSCVLLNGTEFLDQRTIIREDEDFNKSTEIPAPPCEAGVEDPGCICWYGYLAVGMLVLSVICNLALAAIIYKIRKEKYGPYRLYGSELAYQTFERSLDV